MTDHTLHEDQDRVVAALDQAQDELAEMSQQLTDCEERNGELEDRVRDLEAAIKAVLHSADSQRDTGYSTVTNRFLHAHLDDVATGEDVNEKQPQPVKAGAATKGATHCA